MSNLTRADVERIIEQVLDNLSIDTNVNTAQDTCTIRLMFGTKEISRDYFSTTRTLKND